MNLFLFAAVALIGIALLLLLRPWQRSTPDQDASTRELNARVYRDQLAELDRDLAAGTLAPADHEQARAELQRRLIDDIAHAEGSATATSTSRATRLTIAVAVPVLAAGLYAWLGSPAALMPQASTSAQGGTPPHQVTQADIEQMVASLAARLEKNPSDMRGWAILARSYHAMGRLPEAEAAFAHLGDSINQDPVLLSEYADTLAGRANGNLEGKPLQLVMTALQLDPDNAMALSLAATAAYKRRDFPVAAQHWQRLLKQVPPESDDAKWLTKTLAEIGYPVTGAAAGGAGVAAGPAAAPNGTAVAAAGPSISGRVSLAPELASKVQPNDTLFVFARAVEGGRMPLAVQRARVADMPLDFKLDDSMSLAPQFKLSSAKDVRIEARISKSGNATPAAGDLFGMSEVVKPGSTQVALRIDRVRE